MILKELINIVNLNSESVAHCTRIIDQENDWII